MITVYLLLWEIFIVITQNENFLGFVTKMPKIRYKEISNSKFMFIKCSYGHLWQVYYLFIHEKLLLSRFSKSNPWKFEAQNLAFGRNLGYEIQNFGTALI